MEKIRLHRQKSLLVYRLITRVATKKALNRWTGPVKRLAHCHQIAIGPELPNWGSWQWVGGHLLSTLCSHCSVLRFPPWDIPSCDVLIVIKHPPPKEIIQQLPQKLPILYCPIDHYGSVSHIEQDRDWLRRCSRIIIHCQRLRKYFAGCAPVEYVDHPIRFVSPLRETPVTAGPILWIGVRTNLPPLISWINQYGLPGPLIVLTNPETPGEIPSATELGFSSTDQVLVEEWSPEKHYEWTVQCRAALDIKGSDFRAQHKPPAKAFDFLASGVPLAMNAESSPVEHLVQMGLAIPTPTERDHWFSEAYQQDVLRFGRAIRELLSEQRIGLRWRHLLQCVINQHS